LIDGTSECDLFSLWNDGVENVNIYAGWRDQALVNAGYVLFNVIEGVEFMNACNMTDDNNYT